MVNNFYFILCEVGMPATGKERELSEKYNAPLEVWLPLLLREHKTPFKVAAAVGVYEGTVRYWVKKLNKQQGK